MSSIIDVAVIATAAFLMLWAQFTTVLVFSADQKQSPRTLTFAALLLTMVSLGLIAWRF